MSDLFCPKWSTDITVKVSRTTGGSGGGALGTLKPLPTLGTGTGEPELVPTEYAVSGGPFGGGLGAFTGTPLGPTTNPFGTCSPLANLAASSFCFLAFWPPLLGFQLGSIYLSPEPQPRSPPDPEPPNIQLALTASKAG